MAERRKWTDETIDGFVNNVDRRFDKVDAQFEKIELRFQHVDQRFAQVDQRFDRVEGDIRDLRSLNWWLWATTILAIVGLFVTVLLRT